MNILLCLLSDQLIPNLLSVHHCRPDHLALVETDRAASNKLSDRLIDALRLGGVDYAQRHTRHPLPSSDRLEPLRRGFADITHRFPEAQWTANLTGGTKPMCIAAYEVFRAHAAKLIYTNSERPLEVINLESGATEPLTHPITIREFLAAYGFVARKPRDKIEECEQRAARWDEFAWALARHASSRPVLAITDQKRLSALRDRGGNIDADELNAPDDRFRDHWMQGQTARKLTKHEGEFLTGGWLEAFFWNLLTRHARDLDIHDVRLGMTVAPADRPDADQAEFDVAFIRSAGLHIIECKSGDQKHDKKGDALYKMEAITRQFRALHVRSIFATTGGNMIDRDGMIRDSIRTRAAIYNCRILTAPDIRNLARPDATPDDIRATLFDRRER
jgi:hypothetical protein